MLIGVLLCDHLDADVAEQVGDYPSLFNRVFGDTSAHRDEVSLRVYDAIGGELPASPDECDGWIVSGSRRSVYDDEVWIRDLETFIRDVVERERPLVGICFGHQLTAQALGGTVEKADAGWGVGAKDYEVVQSAPWMGTVDSYTIIMSHQDQVTRLPDGAELVSSAPYCPVGAYRIGERVFCVQGHPEWVPELSRILLARRRPIIGDRVVDDGLSSLDQPLDQQQIADWIVAFLTRTAA